MHLEILGRFRRVETIALGRRIRELRGLVRRYGSNTTWRKRKGVAMVRLDGGSARNAELHWSRRRARPDEDQEVLGLMAKVRRTKQFLLCVRNEGCEDLELRKLYEQLPDARAAESGYVRVVDETGEDYLYPAKLFVSVELTREAKRAVAVSLRRRSAA